MLRSPSVGAPPPFQDHQTPRLRVVGMARCQIGSVHQNRRHQLPVRTDFEGLRNGSQHHIVRRTYRFRLEIHNRQRVAINTVPDARSRRQTERPVRGDHHPIGLTVDGELPVRRFQRLPIQIQNRQVPALLHARKNTLSIRRHRHVRHALGGLTHLHLVPRLHLFSSNRQHRNRPARPIRHQSHPPVPRDRDPGRLRPRGHSPDHLRRPTFKVHQVDKGFGKPVGRTPRIHAKGVRHESQHTIRRDRDVRRRTNHRVRHVHHMGHRGWEIRKIENTQGIRALWNNPLRRPRRQVELGFIARDDDRSCSRQGSSSKEARKQQDTNKPAKHPA